MKLNLLSCDAQRPDRRVIANCIADISLNLSASGYSGDTDPHSGHVDPSVYFGLKKILYDKITVFF